MSRLWVDTDPYTGVEGAFSCVIHEIRSVKSEVQYIKML